MKQLENSEPSIIALNGETDNRAFEYAINRKRTKSKLLKGAKRTRNLEVEVKSGCVNLRFNDGSYYEVIMPLLTEWQTKVNQIVHINEYKLHIIEIEKGIETTKKHVDTKVVVMSNDQRYVIHAYNTTQNLMIQGKNCEVFATNCLEPFFTGKIDTVLSKINLFNKHIEENLSSNQLPSKRH